MENIAERLDSLRDRDLREYLDSMTLPGGMDVCDGCGALQSMLYLKADKEGRNLYCTKERNGISCYDRYLEEVSNE